MVFLMASRRFPLRCVVRFGQLVPGEEMLYPGQLGGATFGYGIRRVIIVSGIGWTRGLLVQS